MILIEEGSRSFDHLDFEDRTESKAEEMEKDKSEGMNKRKGVESIDCLIGCLDSSFMLQDYIFL